MPLKEIFNPIEQLCKKTAYRCRHAFVTAQLVCSFVPVYGKSSEKHQCRQQNRREQKNKTRYAAEKGKTDYSECRNLSEDEIFDFITKNIEGDCLLAVGDESLIKIHFHTNTPWKVVEYAASLGEIYDIVIENMERQEQGLQG